MNVQTREQMILEMLNNSSFLLVQDFVDQLQVSPATVRRDLARMQKKNLLKRYRGGAVSITRDSLLRQSDFSPARALSPADDSEKRSIAAAAVSVIAPGDHIFLDGGTTVSYMLDYMADPSITIVTNNLLTAVSALHRGFGVFCTSGEITNTSGNTYSQESLQDLMALNFDKAFIGADGIDPWLGFSSLSEAAARIKRTVISRSAENYILCDRSKFGLCRMYSFASTEEATLVAVNGALLPDYKGTILFAAP